MTNPTQDVQKVDVNHQNVVFPVKFKAKNKETEKLVFVVSTSLVNTSNDSNGKLMVMYTDGLGIYCQDSSEFTQNHTIVTEGV